MRLGHRLENVDHRFGVRQAHFRHRAVGVQRRVAFAVHRGGAVLGDEIHQPGHAHVGFRRRAEERDEMLLLHGVVDAGAKFLLRQAALIEVFGQQGVVGFGDVFDQFAVQLGDLFLPRARWPGLR